MLMDERVSITIPFSMLLPKFGMKTAISLPDLVRETNAFSKKHRPGCQARLINSDPDELFLEYNVTCHENYSDPSGHDVRVQFLVEKLPDVAPEEARGLSQVLDVQVSCSCPAFLYWGAQWNLHQRDGLLGPPRPLLQAPTQRLDLRGNFVICKHIHAVFERILPAVQHNIVKILRERVVERRKREEEKAPEKLREKQEEMKKRREVEKAKRIKDKDKREEALRALEQEEEERLEHERELEEGEEPVVERTAPATEAPAAPAPAEVPAWMKLPARYERIPEEPEAAAITELTGEEAKRIEEAHKKGLPHLHKGLPYEEA